MIIVEYDSWHKGRNRTYETRVDEAEVMNLVEGALVLSTRGGTTVRIFAHGEWKNAALLREVTVKNQLGEPLLKRPLVDEETLNKIQTTMRSGLRLEQEDSHGSSAA